MQIAFEGEKIQIEKDPPKNSILKPCLHTPFKRGQKVGQVATFSRSHW